MKRSIITCLTVSLTIGAFAQTLVKETNEANTRFIPGQYMKNGEAAIYFSSDEYGYTDGSTNYEAHIYDFELKPLRTFNFEVFHPYTVTEKRVSTGKVEKTKVITHETGRIIEGYPSVSDMEARKTAFINMVYEDNRYLDPSITLEGLTAACRVDGNTIYVGLPFDRNSGMYQFVEYLRSVEMYLDVNDIFGYAYTYATEVPVYNGEWSTSTWYDIPVSNFITPRCNDVSRMNHWNGGVYLPFSQTFFNDDEKFEYVRYTAEIAEGAGSDGMGSVMPDGFGDPVTYLFGITANDRDGDGQEDYRQTRYGIHYKGIEVVTEDGEVIYSFPAPDNTTGNASIEFFKSDNSILAQAGFSRYDENGNYVHTIRFYRLDKTSGTAKIVREENHISARPNPATQGTPVEMTLPSATEGNRTVTVTSINGTKIYSRQLESDATKAVIPTDSLQPGIYLFTLTVNGRVSETVKVIIR